MRELERGARRLLVALLQALRAEEAGAGEPRSPPGSAACSTQRRRASRTARRRAAPAACDARPGRLGRLQRPRPREPLPRSSSPTRPTRCSARSESTPGYLAAGGSYFTVETHLSHLAAARGRRRGHVTTQVLDCRREAAAPLPRAAARRRSRPARDGRADAAARRRGERPRGAGARAACASGLPRSARARGARRARIARDARSASGDAGSDAALRAASRWRSSASRPTPGKWGYWFARDAAQGRPPAAGAPRRPERRRAARACPCTGRSPSCRSRPSSWSSASPRDALEQAVDESLGGRGARARRDRRRVSASWGRRARARERAIVERVRAAGAVLVGPNCLGVFDASRRARPRLEPAAGRTARLRLAERQHRARDRPPARATSASASRGSSRSGTRPTSTPPSSSRRSPPTRGHA